MRLRGQPADCHTASNAGRRVAATSISSVSTTVPQERERTDPLADRDWRDHVRGNMVPYCDIDPDEWDLTLRHDGRDFWATDHWCLECDCNEVVIVFQELVDGDTRARRVGALAIDRRTLRPKRDGADGLALQLWEALRAQGGLRERMDGRYREIRRAAKALERRRAARPAGRPEGRRRVGRNAPCPCGSGRKFKRCCLVADAAQAQ